MKYIKGDITTAKGIIAHGVNRQRAMGAGVAKAIVDKYPKVKFIYINISPVPPLGAAIKVNVAPDVVVYNCYTQERYGRNGRYADINAIRISLRRIKITLEKTGGGIINIPKIGAGLGGLNWKTEVEPTILKLEEGSNIEFHVWEL
jgi:O-acetyl-ADP-ribose deacetylase (regulator of RNase III)